jgi:hypothetical protein
MAWSPFQRANAGIIWVEQPGDYANPIPTTAATGPTLEQSETLQIMAEAERHAIVVFGEHRIVQIQPRGRRN